MRKLSRGAYEDTKGLVRAAETLLEVVVITLLYYAAFRMGYEIEHFVYKGKYVLMGVYGALLYVMFLNSDCTLFGQLHRLDLIIGQVISLFVVNFLTYFQLCLIANAMIAVGPMLLLLLAEIVVAVVLIYVYTELYYKLYAPHDMLLVYGNKRGIGLKIKMDSRRDKYNVSKLMSIDEGLEAVCQETRKHDAVILTDIPAQIRNDILKYCYRYRIRTYVAPKLTDIMLRGAKNNTLFDTPLLMVKGTGLTPMQRIIKRAMDLVLCGIAMIPAAPVMLIIAAAIKIEDGGPVFYNAPRVGKDGVDFKMYKLRSMRVNAPDLIMEDGSTYNGADDPRMTKIGAFMRKTSLDEMPQFFNVLLGDMSVVGPRPDLRRETELYEGEEGLKLSVKPGITGYAAVYGRNSLPWKQRLSLDVYYVKHVSFLLDVKVFFRTFATVLGQEGIYVEEDES